MSSFPKIKAAISDLTVPVAVYIAVVSVAAAATAGLLIFEGVGVGSWAGVIALAMVAAFGAKAG